MKKIYIVRHGQSHTNAGGHPMPNAQIPITDLGVEQATGVANWLWQETDGNIESVMVSEYIRTHQTAQPLLDTMGQRATIIDNVQEFNYFAFESIKDQSHEQILHMAKHYWQTQEPDYVDMGDATQAESFEMFTTRTKQALTDLHSVADGTHVLYTHGLFMSMLIWTILNQPIDSNQSMQNFRQFELSIRPKNTEVFLLILRDGELPSMSKVRTVEGSHDMAVVQKTLT